MTFVSETLSITEIPHPKHSLWKLNRPLVYKGHDDFFMVPEGFITDFATVPAFVRSLYPPQGPYSRAAILHDYFCEELKRWHASPTKLVPPPVSSRDADGLFRRTMQESDVKFVRRWMMWTGVRWGALASRHRRAGWWRDAHKVIFISILASPVFTLLLIVNGTIGLIESLLP